MSKSESKKTDFSKDEVYIVNLSAAVKWKTGPKGVQTAGFQAFAELCHQYATPTGCCAKRSKSIFYASNYTWVACQYGWNYGTVIKPYKLGKSSSAEFLTKLLGIFSFLEDAKFSDKTKQNIITNQNRYLSLKGIEIKELSAKQTAFALLEDAWNAPIDFDAESQKKVAEIIKTAQSGKKVILISNTNPLNIFAIMRQITSHFSTVSWEYKQDLTSGQSQETVLQIAPNIFVCFSYVHQVFKTGSEEGNNLSTPNLINLLKTNLELSVDKTIVISQYANDLTMAKTQGMRAIAAGDFFPKLAREVVPAHSNCSLM